MFHFAEGSNDLTAVTVRFTPSAGELRRIRSKFSGARPGLSLTFAIVLAAVFIAQGIINIGFRHGGVFFGLGVCQLVLGLCYVPINVFGRLTTLLLCKPGSEMDITIDDFGLTIARPLLRVPWKNVAANGPCPMMERPFGQSSTRNLRRNAISSVEPIAA